MLNLVKFEPTELSVQGLELHFFDFNSNFAVHAHQPKPRCAGARPRSAASPFGLYAAPALFSALAVFHALACAMVV